MNDKERNLGTYRIYILTTTLVKKTDFNILVTLYAMLMGYVT